MMIRKRALARRLPLLSGVVRRLETLEAENRRLQRYLFQATVSDVTTLTEACLEESTPQGPPLPPGILRYLVAGTDDVAWFLESGRLGMLTLTEALERNGVRLDGIESILDFGCGCGRVIRHLQGRFGGTVHGVDRNSLAVQWCRNNLRFARFEVNPPVPPMPFADGSFDVIYAFSVFTHLRLDAQMSWMEEMWRLLKRGACLVVSLHGDSYVKHLPVPEQTSYREGRPVVLEGDLAGSNGCNVFHPEAFVRRAFSKWFEVLEFVPSGARGNPSQDLYVLRRAPVAAAAASNGRGA